MQKLDGGGTDARAATENEDGLRFATGSGAVWEERERDLQGLIDGGGGGAVTDPVAVCQGCSIFIQKTL